MDAFGILLSLFALVQFTLIQPGESVGADFHTLQKQQVTTWCYWEDPACNPTTWPGTCATGTRQSPIDLRLADTGGVGSVFTHNAINRLGFLYRNQKPTFSHFEIENTGHTVEILLPTPLILTDPFQQPNKGRQYTFSQMHFHWGTSSRNGVNGSEHTLNGRAIGGELHLVHFASQYGSFSDALAASTDSAAVLVIGILLQITRLDNPSLAPIMQQIPSIANFDGATIHHVNAQFNLESLFPDNLDMYRYFGSLTSPTCNEQVQWLVFKEPTAISTAQLEVFHQMRNEVGLPLLETFRQVQPRNGRQIEFYKVWETHSFIWAWLWIIRWLARTFIWTPLRETFMFNYNLASMLIKSRRSSLL